MGKIVNTGTYKSTGAIMAYKIPCHVNLFKLKCCPSVTRSDTTLVKSTCQLVADFTRNS